MARAIWNNSSTYDANTKSLITDGGPTPSWWTYLSEWDQGTLQSEPVGSPMWWLLRGVARLLAERGDLLRFERYWEGDHPLPDIVDRDTQEHYRTLVTEARVNYMRAVVETLSERMRVQGLYLPGDDERADSETWAFWQANELDAWQTVAFAEMVAKRRCYWSVWFPENDGDAPRIEIEDALQTWVELVPGTRNQRAAGIRTMFDDWTGDELAEVQLPNSMHYFRRTGEGWTMGREEVNPLGVVSIVPMVNRPKLRGPETGFSEIEDIFSTQDRINRTVLGRMLAGHSAAFRQKWATGIDVPIDDDGNATAPFVPGVTKLWVAEEAGARFGQFDATDLTNYIKGEEQDIQHIANVSRMPRHYFNPNGQAPSGDSMKSAEAGLVAKIRTMELFAGAAIKEVLRLARQVAGLETPLASELVWGDPEFQTFGQLVDGNVKLVQEGIASRKYAREKVGMSPATMARVESEIAAEQLMSFVDAEPPPRSPVVADESAPVA